MPALRAPLCVPAIPSATQSAGTYTSGPIANAGYAVMVECWVHLSAITSSPTLDVHLESSPDGTTWTQIAGTSITQLTAVGNADCMGLVNNEYVRVTSTVGGTGTATYAVGVVVIPA